MLLLEDTDAYKSAWAYKDIGRSYDAVFQKDHPAGFRWLTESAGSNFRMTEFQAAIGLKQLAKLPDWISKRNHHANVLINGLSQFKFLDVPAFDDVEGNLNAYYRVYIKIKSGFDQLVFNNKSLRDFVISQMEEEGVPCFSGACSEIYKEKLFEEQGLAPEQRLPNANYYTDQALCFLVHHTITDQEMTVIVSKMNVVLSRIKSLIDTK
jgi:dTDP-4-amino-4,6-dideoxygalactose transaminase